MLRDVYPIWRRTCAAAALALALLTGGCSGGSVFGGPATTAASSAAPPPAASPAAPAPSLTDKIESFFSKTATTEAHPTTADQQADINCPLMDIRQGAATFTIPPPRPDGANEAMSVQYQGIFVRAARDCKVVGNQMVMQVGVEGRIIVGPAGGPGQVDVPLRIAVVDAPAGNEKPIVTKLIRIPVVLGPNEGSKSFTHVEQGLAFPMPKPVEFDNYVVYIGFDPFGAEQQEKAKPKPAPRVKPKPSPNTPTG